MKKGFLLLLTLATFMTVSANAQQDWAGLNFYAKQNTAIQQTPTAVFMGNSITHIWWHVDSTFFKSHNYLGRGISGQTSSEMLVRFRQDVINLKPKYVVILSGCNDIAQNNGYISLENIFGNIISMVELAKIHHIKPIICSLLPAYRFPWRKELEPAEKVLELNAMLKNYAKENHVKYVDYHSAMKDEKNGLPSQYSKDGIHPTIDGYKVMEKIILEYLPK